MATKGYSFSELQAMGSSESGESVQPATEEGLVEEVVGGAEEVSTLTPVTVTKPTGPVPLVDEDYEAPSRGRKVTTSYAQMIADLDVGEDPDKRLSVGAPVESKDGKASRATRNNNPGNVKDVGQFKKMPGYKGKDDKGFAIFDSAETGFKVQVAQLKRYLNGKTFGRKLKTIRDIVGKWSPVADKENAPGSTSNYMGFVGRQLGKGLDEDVTERDLPLMARAMATFEGFQGGTKSTPGQVVAGGSDVPVEGAGMTFAEMQGATGEEPAAIKPEEATPPEKEAAFKDIYESPLGAVARGVEAVYVKGPQIAAKKAEEAWDYVSKRINGEVRTVAPNMSATQIADTTKGMTAGDAKKVTENLTTFIPKMDPSMMARGAQKEARVAEIPTVEQETEKIKASIAERQRIQVKGFIENLDNPTRLVLEESLPANFVESIFKAPEHAYDKLDEATKIIQQYEIVRNPDRYPAVSVDAAKRAIADREAADKMPKPNTREMFSNLWAEAKRDPGGMAATLVNAIVADPELILTPAGVGLRSARLAEIAAKTGNVARRATVIAAKLTNKVVDPALTGAGTNVAIAETAAASEGKELTSAERATAALTGAVPAATIGVFTRGAAGKAALGERGKGRVLNEADLETALNDTAAEAAVVQQVVTNPEKVNPDVRKRIEEQLGIHDQLTDTQRAESYKRWKTELKKIFKDEAEYADWSQRVATTRDSVRASEAAQAAQALEEQGARTARLASEYDQALAARDRARQLGEEESAYSEDVFRTATRRMDEQDIFESALEGNIPQIRDAMNRAAARDSKLNVPKWQRGSVNETVLKNLGIASIFAGTAFAASPKEQKVSNAFMATLAALVLPRGGSGVLRKMRQSGAISADGELLSMLKMVKNGDLKPTLEVAEIRAKELDLVTRAKTGDQKAYAELFKDNYADSVRHARKFTRGTDIDPEDVASEAMARAFQQLDKYNPDFPFGAWVYGITKNAAANARRDLSTLKGGGEYDIQSSDLSDVRTQFGEIYARDAFDEGAGAEMEVSPESIAIRQDSEKIITNTLEKMSEAQRRAFILSKIEGHEFEEIAKMTGQNVSTVSMQVKTAQDKILDAVQKGLNARKAPPKIEEPVVKRGRGRPRKQAGEIDQRLLQVGGVVSLGAMAGAYLNDQNKLLGAAGGAALAGALMSRGRKGVSVGQHALKAIDYTTGVTSTRIMNKSKELWWRAHETERRILKDTHIYQERVKPFVTKLRALPTETKNVLSRAILTGKPGVTDRLLHVLGDEELKADWKEVRSVLDKIKDEQIALGRYMPGELDYFPRMVKDLPGLLKALGRERGSYVEEAIRAANKKSISESGQGLSEIEKSLIVNQILKQEQMRSRQPGFAKDRVVEEVTPELQKFYHEPAESLDNYLRAAVDDIETAKFFGQDIKVHTKDGKKYTNVDQSAGATVERLIKEGKLSPEDFDEVAGMLRSRFTSGDRAPHEVIQAAKNLSYAGLLGNPLSATVQLGDAVIQAFTQDISSAIRASFRVATGRKHLDMKDFGLVNHIAEEFSSTTKSAKFLNKVFKYSLFQGMDAFGKNVALNAAVIKLGKQAKTLEGVEKISTKYKEYLGPGEIQQLVKDLQKGENSDLVQAVSFAELTRSQPVTRLELPQAYLDHPNGRLLYQFKTFMIKQVDLARREGLNEFKKGNYAKGARNLAELGLALGVAGTATDKIKDFLLGRDIDLKLTDIPENMMKTFGITEYFMDNLLGVSKEEARERRAEGDKRARTKKADPLEALTPSIAPAKMFTDIVRGDPKAMRYIPFIGRHLYEYYEAQEAKK